MPYASVFRDGLFADRVAVVSGGGSGIGRCIAHELAALGARVVLAGRDVTKLERVSAEIAGEGGRAEPVGCNIREEAEVARLFETTLERCGRLDFLVNNAGGQFISPAETISAKGWRAVVETNLTGTFLMCREAHRQHLATHGGAIVNIVADMFGGMPMMAHSGAARAGVVNLTRTLALEWAQHRVRVNAVAPGVILSSGMKNYPEPVQEALTGLGQQLPGGRLGTESEVAAAVVFLLSPAAAYITGDTLRVDGGSSLDRHVFPLASGTPVEPFRGFHLAADLPGALQGDDG
jgi:citronellol/citronellal dehydrogenase